MDRTDADNAKFCWILFAAGVAINGDFCEPPRLFLIGRSCCLLHCDRHTAHGGRNFSADPGTTEL
jgi:hypothetical protein